MKTMHFVSAGIATIIACMSFAHAADGFVHLEVHETPVDQRKVLDMRFDETARDALSSTVDVTFVSGGSVASSMFVMSGMCAIARARNRASFTSEPVDGRVGRYRVTFPTPADGPMSEMPAHGNQPAQRLSGVVTVQQCALVGF